MTENNAMKKVAITGAAGQLGTHCRARLQHHFRHDVIAIDRELFSDTKQLSIAINEVDAIVHLAGINRGDDTEILNGNPEIAKELVEACKTSKNIKTIIYASSIQIDRGNIYGRSKKQAADIINSFCNNNGIRFVNLILPNLFGEFSKPNYNNFVGTFCHQISNNKEVSIHQDSDIELAHYGDIAVLIGNLISNDKSGEIRPSGYKTTVGSVAEKLQTFHRLYSNGVIPNVRDTFDLKLFNSLRQMLFDKQFPFELTRHADQRGSFFECIRSQNNGQTSFSTTVPRVTRGDHFHFEKIERFLVLQGDAKIRVRKLYSDKVIEFNVSGDNPCYIDMPTMHTHNIKNTGSDELLTLFWTHDFFDPENTDTYIEAV